MPTKEGRLRSARLGDGFISDTPCANRPHRLLANRAQGCVRHRSVEPERPNGAFGTNDIEGKTATVAASDWKGASFK